MAHRYRPLLRPAFSAAPPGVAWVYAEMPPDLAHRRPDVPASRHRHGIVEVPERLPEEIARAFDWEYLGPS
jgi:hypothetical protein